MPGISTSIGALGGPTKSGIPSIAAATLAHWFLGSRAEQSAGALTAWKSVAVGDTPVSVAIVGAPTVAESGGQQYVHSDGVADILTADALAAIANGNDKPFVWFVDMSWDSVAAGTQTILSFSNSADATTYTTFGRSTAVPFMRRRLGGSAINWNVEQPDFAAGTRVRCVLLYTGTQWYGWQNGVPYYRNGQMTADQAAMTMDRFEVFARRTSGASTEYTAAKLWNFGVVQATALTTAEALAITAYFGVSMPWATLTAPSGTKETYLCLGQSNMSGASTGSHTADTTVPFINVDSSNTYVGPGPLAQRSDNKHGPEFGVTTASKALGYAPNIIKRSVGGTSLANSGGTPLCWLPSVSDEHYSRTMNWVTVTAQPYFNNIVRYARGTIDYVLWAQGEQDSTDAAQASAYGTNLTALSTQLRTDLGNASLPMVAMLLHKNSAAGAFVTDVRTGILAWNAADPVKNLIAVIDDLALNGDSVHLTSASLDTMGARMVDAVHFQDVVRWIGPTFLASGATWTSYRGGNQPLTEATNKPTATTLNGIAAVAFVSASSQKLTYAALSSTYSDPTGAGMSLSFTCVLKYDATTANAVNFGFKGPAGTPELLEWKINASKWSVVSRTTAGTTTTRNSTWTVTTATHHIFSFNLDTSGNIRMRVDGVDVTPATATLPVAALSLNSFTVGCRADGTNFLSQKVGDLLFGRSKTLAQQQSDEALMAAIWGITLP